MQANDRVRIKDVLAIQRYRTRFWRQTGGKLPPQLPSLSAVYKVRSVIMEVWAGGGDPVEVAHIVQESPLIGKGLAFRIPTDGLILEKPPETE